MNAQYKTVDHDDQLREAFRRFDKEENGFVNEEEIKSMLMTLGEPLSKAEVENWIKGGENFIRNGKIYYEELATFMLSK